MKHLLHKFVPAAKTCVRCAAYISGDRSTDVSSPPILPMATITTWLPLELWERIIDEVDASSTPDSRQALYSCTLVSHAFYNRARLHTFKSIRVGFVRECHFVTSNRALILCELLEDNPGLVKYIRHLTVKVFRHEDTPVNEPGIAGVVTLLDYLRTARDVTKVECFTLDAYGLPGLIWPQLPAFFRASVIHFCRAVPIKSLQLVMLYGFLFSPLLGCVNIEDLGLHYSMFHGNESQSNQHSDQNPLPPSSSDITPFAFSFPQLKTLTVNGYIRNHVSVGCVAQSAARHPQSMLETVRAEVNGVDDFAALMAILFGAKESLRELKISFRDLEPHEIVKLDVGSFCSLLHVVSENLLSDCASSGKLTTSFRMFNPSTPSSSIKSITIRIELNFYNGDNLGDVFSGDDWSLLDRFLTGTKFPALRSVEVEAMIDWATDRGNELDRLYLEQAFRWRIDSSLPLLISSPTIGVHVYVDAIRMRF
ncbi:unnamed protein product [Cyclocybe aegerita]|uniref:Uncharacterized protein n=1 Tax=Cyclocybe aegerita TaxID=1973307 RepID=A0A8S0W4P6_CYCAE|nr:unnamed protein product [Cyclocybe aegerita]